MHINIKWCYEYRSIVALKGLNGLQEEALPHSL